MMKSCKATDICTSDNKMRQISKINIETDLPSGKKYASKIFRKPKRAIKMFPFHNQAAFSDRNLIQQQLNARLGALTSNCKDLKRRIKTEKAYIPLSERANEKIFDIYSDIRKNEMFALCLPLPQKMKSNSKQQILKLEISEVQKIRSRTQVKKIAIPQSLFKGTLPCKISYSVGFKGQGFKPLEKILSIKREASAIASDRPQEVAQQKHRSRSQVSLCERQSQFSRMLRKQTNKNVCSPKIKGQYRSKSRLKSIWDTIALHKHNNSANK